MPMKKKPAASPSKERYFKKPAMRPKAVNLERFLTDMLRVMMAPVKFFGSIKSDGKYEDTIVKILIYGLIAAGIKILFSIASITVLGAITSALLMGVHAILVSFGLAGMALFFAYLAKGEMDFEKSFKAVASCIFMYPLAFTAYHLAFAYPVLFFLSIMIDLYLVFLMYNIVIYALKGNSNIAHMVFGIAAAFIVILHFSDAADGYLMSKNKDVVIAHVAANFNK